MTKFENALYGDIMALQDDTCPKVNLEVGKRF